MHDHDRDRKGSTSHFCFFLGEHDHSCELYHLSSIFIIRFVKQLNEISCGIANFYLQTRIAFNHRISRTFQYVKIYLHRVARKTK